MVPVTRQITSFGSVIAGMGASTMRTSLLLHHWRVSWLESGRKFGVLVVLVGRSPMVFWAWLARVVVIPGGVILEESILKFCEFSEYD